MELAAFGEHGNVVLPCDLVERRLCLLLCSLCIGQCGRSLDSSLFARAVKEPAIGALCCTQFGFGVDTSGDGIPDLYRYPSSQSHNGMLVSFNIQYEEIAGGSDQLRVQNSTGGV